MPQNAAIQAPAGAWTQLTNADASAVSIQNLSGFTIKLQATNGATPPASNSGAFDLLPWGIFTAQYLLSDIWPGVTGANRLWVWADVASSVRVSHA